MMRRRRRSIVLAVLLLAAVSLVVFWLSDPDGAELNATAGEAAAEAPSTQAPRKPSHSLSPSPSPSASPTPEVVDRGNGEWTYAKAPKHSETFGSDGTTLRFNVAVEGDIEQDIDDFNEMVVDTLADERGWIAGKQWRFEQVGEGWADFTVYLASPQTRAELCAADDTYTSCRNGNSVVINLERWLLGVPHWSRPLDEYRQYVVNHEVGHRLGEPHVVCPKSGTPSPVMAQQTIELRGCEPNAWPYVDGEYVTGPAGEYN